MKKPLSNRQLRAEFLKGIYRALDSIVTNEEAKRRLRAVASRTYLVTVPGEHVSRGFDVKTEGENIQQMVVLPGFFKMVRRAYVVIPEEKFRDIALLRSGNPDEMRRAEEAMQVVAHETAHTFLNSIDYERQRAQHYMQNPKLLTRKMAKQILAAGVIRDEREAIEKARALVDTRPIFTAGYIAHAEHEFVADAVGEDIVGRLVKGRRPTVRELVRCTWRRPAPVRAILMEELRTMPRKREQRSFLEHAARLWETTSEKIFRSLDTARRLKELEHPGRPGFAFAHARRFRPR